MADILSASEIEDIQASVAPSLGDELVSIAEVWRRPENADGVVAGGGGVDEYGDKIEEGTTVDRPDQRYAKVAQYPVRITHAGIGNEKEYAGQYVAVAPWTLTFNWADNPDIGTADKLLIRVDDWVASEAVSVGDVRQPTASNGRYYVATVAGTTDLTEPAWPLDPKGETVEDGTVTWALADKLRTFEPKDAGGVGTFNVVRMVRCDEVKA